MGYRPEGQDDNSAALQRWVERQTGTKSRRDGHNERRPALTPFQCPAANASSENDQIRLLFILWFRPPHPIHVSTIYKTSAQVPRLTPRTTKAKFVKENL